MEGRRGHLGYACDWLKYALICYVKMILVSMWMVR